MSSISKFEIRQAVTEDVSLILSFIRELAEYEHLLHEVVATEEDIHRALFSDHPSAEAVIGNYNGVPIGFALYFKSFSTFLGKAGIYLEDLYIKPNYRSKGFGRQLLVYLAKLVKQRGYDRLEWSVLLWNELAINTYQRINAVPMNEWMVYRLTGDALEELTKDRS